MIEEGRTAIPGGEHFLKVPADSDVLIVVFGSLRAKPGRFQFITPLERLRASKLFLCDPSRNWYNAGVPGVGESVDEIAAWIEREAIRMGARRVIAIGSSMGAYAAILFGCMIGAERAVALAPQTVLDSNLGRAPEASVALRAPDLRDVILAAPETKIEVVVGWNDLEDVFHARRVADLPSVRVLAVLEGHHLFVERLHEEGALIPLITALIEGGMPDPRFVEFTLDDDDDERISDALYAARREDWETVLRRLGLVAERYPDWAAPARQIDLARRRAGHGA